MPMTPAEMYEAIVRNLQKNTGKPLQEWMDIVSKSGPKERRDKVDWLKSNHGLGNGQATTIIKMMNEGITDYDEAHLMKLHFNGDKGYQKPIYDKITAALKMWGKHKITVNKTYLSLIHNQKFAILKTTKSGMVIGVTEAAVKKGRNKEFISSKNPGSERITHKLVVNDVSDLTDGVIRVLKASYDLS